MDSFLIGRIKELEQKSVDKYSIEDLRIAIGQNCNLQELIPLAITKLKEDLFVEGDYYPGDLLMSVLSSDRAYWLGHRDAWKEVIALCSMRKAELESEKLLKRVWLCLQDFESIP